MLNRFNWPPVVDRIIFWLHSYDDFSSGVPLFKIPEGLSSLIQWVTFIYN